MGTNIQPSGFQFSLITACADVYTSHDLPDLSNGQGLIIRIQFLYRSDHSGLYCYRITFQQTMCENDLSAELLKIAEGFAEEINRVDDWQEAAIEI